MSPYLKESKLNIALMVNIMAILFSMQALLKSIFNGNTYFNLIGLTFGLIILYVIYYIFISSKNIFSENLDIIIKTTIFMTIYSLILIISGGDKSPYKVLFIFSVINTTLRKGSKIASFIAILSSVITISIDLMYMHNHLIITDLISDVILAGLFLIVTWMLGYFMKLSLGYINNLENLANKDNLTDLYNHGYFYSKLTEAMKISKAKHEQLSLIFLDIDDFKYYNDLNGHQQGDYALKNLACTLKTLVRPTDVICRYGGEEFTVILPNTGEKEALVIAERIREGIESTKFASEENQPNGKFTISLGVSSFPSKAQTELDLIKSADDALYRAKFLHKNRVETYTSILDGIKDIVDDHDKEAVASIKTLINIINAKDKYTYSHTERVVIYAKLIADKLNLSNKDKLMLIRGAYMHDIGKINISKEILIKRPPLTDKEWLQLKEHPTAGFEIIRNIDALKNIAPIILYHHERYDGSGYPSGLKGQDIPYLARVLTVVDSFDAMTSNRPYGTRKSFDEAKGELLKYSGIQFDPDIVKTFADVIDEIK